MTKQTRRRYLKYLPAIYQEMPGLDEFLLPFQVVLRGFECLLSHIDRYFAPALTETDFLPWLATWVALTLDEGWDEAKQRLLIGEAVTLYRERGTVQGLKRYLKIYTGLEPEIRECRWPGGMQIGISSQIGGEYRVSGVSADGCPASAPHDYYVVDGVDNGQPRRWYYRADRVASVEVGDGYVIVDYFPPGSTQLKIQPHTPATITRRDGLIHGCYILRRKLEDGTETTIEYRGSTVLVGEVELPYRFIVDVRVSAEKVELAKVRAIVELEKPAHTWYYLKLTPVVGEHVLQRGHYG